LPLRTSDCRPHRGLIARAVKSAKFAKENKKTFINVYCLSAGNGRQMISAKLCRCWCRRLWKCLL